MDYKDLQWRYDHAACGLVTFKVDGTIVYLNQTILKWLGGGERNFVKFTDLLYKGGRLFQSFRTALAAAT